MDPIARDKLLENIQNDLKNISLVNSESATFIPLYFFHVISLCI